MDEWIHRSSWIRDVVRHCDLYNPHQLGWTTDLLRRSKRHWVSPIQQIRPCVFRKRHHLLSRVQRLFLVTNNGWTSRHRSELLLCGRAWKERHVWNASLLLIFSYTSVNLCFIFPYWEWNKWNTNTRSCGYVCVLTLLAFRWFKADSKGPARAMHGSAVIVAIICSSSADAEKAEK